MSLLETYVPEKINLITVTETILHVDEYIIWMSEALTSTNSFDAKENKL